MAVSISIGIQYNAVVVLLTQLLKGVNGTTAHSCDHWFPPIYTLTTAFKVEYIHH